MALPENTKLGKIINARCFLSNFFAEFDMLRTNAFNDDVILDKIQSVVIEGYERIYTDANYDAAIIAKSSFRSKNTEIDELLIQLR